MRHLKYKPVSWLFILVFVYSITSCRPGNKPTVPIENKLAASMDCKEIEQYPSLFSYMTDSLRNILLAQRSKALSINECKQIFTDDAFEHIDLTKEILFSGAYEIFPIQKITYTKATVIVFLVKAKDEEYAFENDKISLVMLNREGQQADILNINLLNSFGGKEVNILSPVEFEVLWTDDEYSPDPESEAENIKNGYKPVTSLITTLYEIDTLALKFIQKRSWQVDIDRPLGTTAQHPPILYFASTSPNAMRKTSLYEYLKISYTNDSVWGVGAGDFMEGSQPWTLIFKGKLRKETTMELSVSYHQKDEEPFTASEIWTLDPKKERLYRKDWNKSNNPMGAAEYHTIDPHEIPKYYDEMIPQMGAE